MDDDPVLFDSDELDMKLTKSQADLVLVALNLMSNPRYLTPPYTFNDNWKYTKARKTHVDEFGNTIRSGQLYLASGRFTPFRISFVSVCGLWALLQWAGWTEILREKAAARQATVDEQLLQAAESVSRSIEDVEL